MLNRREFLAVAAALSAAAPLARAAVAPQSRAQTATKNNPADSAIPRLDALAGRWWKTAQLRNFPAVNSCLGGCQATADVLAVTAATLPPYAQGFTSGALTINGKAVAADSMRWLPHEMRRRGVSGPIAVETRVCMPFDAPGVFTQIILTNPGSRSAGIDLAMELIGACSEHTNGWNWNIPRPETLAQFQAHLLPGGNGVLIRDSKTPARTVFTIAVAIAGRHKTQSPLHIAATGSHGTASGHITIAPGKSVVINLVMAIGSWEPELIAQAQSWSKDFDASFAEVKTRWQQLFDAAFTPGNSIFSGRLPVLTTPDRKIRRIYYISVLSLLANLRTKMPIAHRAYITGSPLNAASVMYFWDTFTWATLHALLDPAEMKNMIRRWLKLDIHSCYAQDMLTGGGVGPWYSFNDYVVFYQISTYLRVTGDFNFLEERVGPRRVMEHLEQFATWWKKLVKPHSPLADYGAAYNLLECVPTYTHVVASLNAANIWMMREMADLWEIKGKHGRARALRAQANKLLPEVLQLYVPGKGYFNTRQPNGRLTAVRHCVDFFTVSECLHHDLPATMKNQMAGFVNSQLLTEHWMRALSLKDPAAKDSNRPDHGPMGAYDAWPPFTMEAMCRLGHWRDAVDFLRRCEPTTHEGPYGQSHELLTRRRDSPVRKAARGGQMYNCTAGTAFAEILIRNFFGFRPNWSGQAELFDPQRPRGFLGRLSGIRCAGKLLAITSTAGGVRMGPMGASGA